MDHFVTGSKSKGEKKKEKIYIAEKKKREKYKRVKEKEILTNETICVKCQNLFSGKNKENISKSCLLKSFKPACLLIIN